MKVLILSCNTGGGHNAAARAILEEMQRRGLDARMEDALRFGGPKASRIVSEGYVRIAKDAPALFGGLYRAGGLLSSGKRKSPVYYANALCAGALAGYIRQEGFDAAVCPHLFPAEALTRARRELPGSFRFYAVATDYTCIPFMEETEPDLFFLPHADLAQEFVSRGIARETLLATGIPVSSRFLEREERQAARRALGLPEEGRILLLMTGSMGFGDVLPLPEALCGIAPDVRVVVLTGNNARLREQLCARYGEGGRVRALPFTEEVPRFFAAADVVLTKPGGLTSTEAAVFGVPLIHTDPIPGCETRNAAFFSERGLSVQACGREEIVRAASRLLNDPDACARMRAAQAQTLNRHAARDIADIVERGGRAGAAQEGFAI